MEKRKIISREEALLFNEQVISKWEPSTEVWPYSYGNDILGLMAAFSGGFATQFFRKQLNIRPYARITCYLPSVGLPAFGCYIFQTYVMTTDILTRNACPLCLTTKASLAQAAFGVVFPLAVSTVSCFHVADRLLTYPIPPLLKAPKEVFLLFQRLARKNTRAFFVLCGLNIIAAAFITYQKQAILFNLDVTPKKKYLSA